ncbi:MAG: hypothetical protein ACE15D_12630 [Candidatus Eisenbacteria bacterium]
MRLWILAILLTLAAAAYQRMTGPTHPVSGVVEIEGERIRYRLPRSHGGAGGAPVSIAVPDRGIDGFLVWRWRGAGSPADTIPLRRDGERLVAALPHQPPAAKVAYRIHLQKGGASMPLPPEGPIVLRFKGRVSPLVLVPHVVAMFLGMLWSNRTGLEALRRRPKLRNGPLTSFVLIAIGGMILGPIVQKQAFGAYWTGVPWGWDLTDNKTLIAFLAWGIAALLARRRTLAREASVAAAAITLVIFLIPHSLLGSELKYEDRPRDAAGVLSAAVLRTRGTVGSAAGPAFTTEQRAPRKGWHRDGSQAPAVREGREPGPAPDREGGEAPGSRSPA